MAAARFELCLCLWLTSSAPLYIEEATKMLNRVPQIAVRALAASFLAASTTLAPVWPAAAQTGFDSACANTTPPPPLPTYEQPPLPAPGYLWTPGYWSAGVAGYYWVPGTWVQPPAVGLLWTPGYWGFHDGFYAFSRGYWGPHIGFYGGINYGFGYGGVGFEGGFWHGGVFSYNRAVNNFGGVHITNVYNKTVINTTTINNHTSFNGPGGIAARPTREEAAYEHEKHVAATEAQQAHQQQAAQNKALLASENHGHPAIAATARPGDFHSGIVPAREEVPGHAARAEPARPEPPRPVLAHPEAARPEPAHAAHAAPREATHPEATHAAPREPAHPAAEHAAHEAPRAHEARPAEHARPAHPARPEHEQRPAHAEHAPAPAPHHEAHAPHPEHAPPAHHEAPHPAAHAAGEHKHK